MWVWATAVAAVLLNSDGLDRRPPPRLLPFDPLPWSGWFTRPDMRYRAMPYVADSSYNFSCVASCCGTGAAAFSEPNVVAASRKHGLFSPGDECYGDHVGHGSRQEYPSFLAMAAPTRLRNGATSSRSSPRMNFRARRASTSRCRYVRRTASLPDRGSGPDGAVLPVPYRCRRPCQRRCDHGRHRSHLPLLLHGVRGRARQDECGGGRGRRERQLDQRSLRPSSPTSTLPTRSTRSGSSRSG